MYRQNQNYIYELEEYKDDVPFENFNRPNNKCRFEGKEKVNFLPNAFSHWTYVATGGQFMIVDV